MDRRLLILLYAYDSTATQQQHIMFTWFIAITVDRNCLAENKKAEKQYKNADPDVVSLPKMFKTQCIPPMVCSIFS